MSGHGPNWEEDRPVVSIRERTSDDPELFGGLPNGQPCPSFPPCDCAERYRKHQARRLGVFLGGLVCAALGVLVGEVLAVLGVTVALCAVLSPPSPTIVTAHRRRPERKQMTSARWLSEPPLEIPGVSESDVRVYHR